MPRKLFFLTIFGLGRIFLAVLSFFENQGMTTILIFAIVKLCLSFEFFFIYIITGDVFPVELRGMAFGICNLIGRIGGIVSSNLVLISEVSSISMTLLISLITFTSIFSVACI